VWIQAWSSIVVSLIPNVGVLERHLDTFRGILEADEVHPLRWGFLCVCVCVLPLVVLPAWGCTTAVVRAFI
jgi:hypothetical protein